MEFPHLSDTEFPILNTVDVYSFKNEFDYTRWIPDTDITLCSVLWDRDYNDVVKFDSNELRDAYFNGMSNAYKVTLETDARIVPEGYVKLPIPYDVMARYNYLYVDLPIATSAAQMIDYESVNGVRRWYFFIDNIRYMAPNTTEVFLTLDVWTNFINDMRFKYAMLERGHAPLSVTDTDRFLADPINNSEYLLEDDVNFGVPNIVKNTRMIPVGNGTKYLCFAMTAEASVNGLDFGMIFADSSCEYTRPLAYYNVEVSGIEARNGYQVGVSNFGIGNGKNYRLLKTQVKPGINSSDNTVPNNLSCIAVKASDCIGSSNFLTYMMENRPTFFNSVQCCFMVGADMVYLERVAVMEGYEIFEVHKNTSFPEGITLTKEMFGYDEKYERFAKLYTSPYAAIEISDDNGKTATIEIETISPLNRVHKDFSIAYPYLNARVFLTGIGYYGVDQTRYDWRKIDDELLNVDTPVSEWAKYLFEFDIPTYAIFMDGETAWNMRNYHRGAEGARLSALTAYHNGARDANTAYENALADHATAYTNAGNIAATEKTNSDNLANTIKTNDDNIASTIKNNVDRSADTAYTNNGNTTSNMAANMILNIARNNANVTESVNDNNAAVGLQNGNAARTTGYNNDLIANTVVANNDLTVGLAQNNAFQIGFAGGSDAMVQLGNGTLNAVGSFISGDIGGAVSSITTAPVNAVARVANAYVDIVTLNNNTSLSIQTDSTVANLQQQHNADINDLNRQTQLDLQSYKNQAMNRSNVNNNAADDSINNNNISTMNTNALNSRDATKTNAANTKTTANTNAQNTYDDAVARATNVKTTADTNRGNTKSTADANSGYTRGNAIENLKETLETSQAIAQAAMLDAANMEPVRFSEYSGDMSGDVYMNRGIRIRLKTQTKDAIARTGDYFARYGYAVNRIWDVEESGLNIMNHFTYWKFSDIWVDDIQASNSLTQSAIHDILMRGTTVWSDPDEIGRVNVYGN